MKTDLCHLDLAGPWLAQMLLLCKSSFIGYITDPWKYSIGHYLTDKLKFLHTNNLQSLSNNTLEVLKTRSVTAWIS